MRATSLILCLLLCGCASYKDKYLQSQADLEVAQHAAARNLNFAYCIEKLDKHALSIQLIRNCRNSLDYAEDALSMNRGFLKHSLSMHPSSPDANKFWLREIEKDKLEIATWEKCVRESKKDLENAISVEKKLSNEACQKCDGQYDRLRINEYTPKCIKEEIESLGK